MQRARLPLSTIVFASVALFVFALLAGCSSKGLTASAPPPVPLVPFTYSATTLNFPAGPIGGNPTTQTLTVTNPNASAVALTVTALTGANPGDFTSATTCGATLAANANCTFTFGFSATALGTRSAGLTLTAVSTATMITLNGSGLPGENVTSHASLCVAPKVVCLASIAASIADAATYFATFDATYTITLPPGTHDFGDETLLNGVMPGGVFDVSGIRPTNGLLIITGAGSLATTLISNLQIVGVRGTNISHIHFNGMTLMRNSISISQGVVTGSAPGQVTLTIMPGFPTPVDLYAGSAGKYLRAYDNSNPLLPHINTDPTNTQIGWGSTIAPVCTGMSCTIYFDQVKGVLPAIYTQPNQIACIKEESGAQAYYFNNIGSKLGTGTDVGFNDIVWYDSARGVWRDIINPFVTNSAIRRRPAVNGQLECMADPAGGPQFGQPGDGAYPLSGVYVNNFVSEATGDDALAVFNDTTTTGILSNTNISNSFARTINLYNSCNIQLINNVGNYCSPQFDTPTTYNGCITDTSPKPTPCGPNL